MVTLRKTRHDFYITTIARPLCTSMFHCTLNLYCQFLDQHTIASLPPIITILLSPWHNHGHTTTELDSTGTSRVSLDHIIPQFLGHPQYIHCHDGLANSAVELMVVAILRSHHSNITTTTGHISHSQISALPTFSTLSVDGQRLDV